MAVTAASSAPSLSPRPIQRPPARAAASVPATSSRARLRSGAWREVTTGCDRQLVSDRRAAGPGGPPGGDSWGRGPDRGRAQRAAPGHRSGRAGRRIRRSSSDGGLPARRGLRTVLSNVPRIDDVETMANVLRAMGAAVERREQRGRGGDDAPGRRRWCPAGPYELFERMRASVVVLGLLLASLRRRSAMPLPGGDDFGDQADRLPRQRAQRHGCPVRVLPRRGARHGARAAGWWGPGWSWEYPSRHGDGQPADGGRPRQGLDRDRERRQGARGGRLGLHAVRHGGGGARAGTSRIHTDRRADRAGARRVARPRLPAGVPGRGSRRRPDLPYTGGAILGDRVRMTRHQRRSGSVHPVHGHPRMARRTGAALPPR